MKKINLNFGIKDEKLVDISEVPSGLDCGCICPSCGSKLVARKGDKRKHHFSHYKVRECEGYLETVLHLAAKEILLNNREIVLPIYNVEDDNYSNQRKYPYVRVFSERRVQDIVPDIILDFGDKNYLFVEIKVTHEVDDVKLEKLKRIGVSTLEIDLSLLEFEENVLELEDVKNFILYDTSFKHWVYDKQYKKNRERRKKYLEDLRKEEERQRIEKERQEKFFKEYRIKNYYKGFSIGVLWLNENNNLSGYIFYEEKEYHVLFEKNFSSKKNSPKYIMKYQDEDGMWFKVFGAGALWEKENGQLNGHILIDLKKYYVSLIPEEEQAKKKPYFYVKLIKKETIRKKQNNTVELSSKEKREITQKDEDIVSYFNFYTEGIRLINELKYRREYRKNRDRYFDEVDIHLRETKKDISIVEYYINLIDKENHPDDFQDVNEELRSLFCSYGKLLEGQYKFTETNDEKYKKSINMYKEMSDIHKDLSLKNLIIALVKNKVPFQNEGDTIFLDY